MDKLNQILQAGVTTPYSKRPGPPNRTGIAAPLTPMDLEKIKRQQYSPDPVIANLQKLGRGIKDFIVPDTPIETLGFLGAPAKAAATVGSGLLKRDALQDLKNILEDKKLTDLQKYKLAQENPAILKAVDDMDKIPETRLMQNYGTPEFAAKRSFVFGNNKITGYENAVDELYKGGRKLAYLETGKKIPKNIMQKNTSSQKTAHIVIGPPASGKSAISNPLAIKNKATIIDSDEAKKVLPEYQGGIGANAVHHESKILSNNVLDVAISRGDNLVIPRVGGSPEAMKSEIINLKNKGYKVNLVLTEIDPDLALVRMNKRFVKKGRLINPKAAEAYKGKPNITYETLKKEGIADGYGKIDTTTPIGQPKKVYEDTARIFKETGL